MTEWKTEVAVRFSIRTRRRCRFPLLVALTMLFGCCTPKDQFTIKRLVEPDYPVEARAENIQGTVEVALSVGVDGRVLSATGSGANPILVRSAEQNARQWVFRPPRTATFPLFHTVTYVYRLEGQPAFVMLPTTVKANLPDRLEIVGRPFKSDLPPLHKASPQAGANRARL